MKNRLGRVWPYLVLAGAWLFSVGLFALTGMHNLNSDMSSELVLADLLNEEGRIVTDSWYYSTEIRVFSPVMLYQLGLLLFGSWHAAHTFSVAVTLTLAAAGMIYMMRGADIKEAAPYAAAAVVLPTGAASRFTFTYGGCYTLYCALSCFVLGVVVRMRRGRKSAALCAVMFLACVWGGLNGVRMMMVCAAPLALTMLWCVAEDALESGSVKTALTGENAGMLLGTGIACAGFASGYLINALVLMRLFNFQNQNERMILNFELDRLIVRFRDLCAYLGWHRGGRLLGLTGVCAFAAIGLAVMVFVAPAKMARRRGGLDAGGRMLARFGLCGVVLGIFLIVSAGAPELGVGDYAVPYYIAGLMVSLAMGFVLIWRSVRHMAWLRVVLATALSCVFGLQALQYAVSDMERGEAGYEAVADFLVESGVTQGFTSYWNGNVLTQASDGAIEAYVYRDWYETELYPWLQKTAHLEQLPEGRVFIYVGADENIKSARAAEGCELVFENEAGRVYFCDDAQAAYDRQRGVR